MFKAYSLVAHALGDRMIALSGVCVVGLDWSEAGDALRADTRGRLHRRAEHHQ